MRLRHRLLALGVASLLAGPVAAEAREQRVIAIAGHEMTVALPEGDCFLDSDLAGDRKRVEAIAAGAGDGLVLLLAFADCPTIEGWRAGGPAAMPRFGYVTIAEAHLEEVFAFDQAALAQAISQALADRGTADYRADIVRMAADLERLWPSLPPAGRRDLGIVHRDRFGPVLATLVNVPATDGKPFPRVVLHQSILAAGKVINVVATRDYRDSETIFDAYGDLSALAEATAASN